MKQRNYDAMSADLLKEDSNTTTSAALPIPILFRKEGMKPTVVALRANKCIEKLINCLPGS